MPSSKINSSTRALAVTVLLTAGGLFAATPAHAAAPVTCGAVLHQDAYLTADLACPSGNGLTAAGPITIDLRGHHLTGSAAATGITVEYPNSVTIEHGRLSGWRTGLTVVSSDPKPDPVPATITVIAMNFVGNGTGLDPGSFQPKGLSAPLYRIVRSWFESNDAGIGKIVGNAYITVSGTTFRWNNTAVSLAAANFETLGHITVSKSQFIKNTLGVLCGASACTLDHDSFLDNTFAVRTGANTLGTLVMQNNTLTGSRVAVYGDEGTRKRLDSNIFVANTTAVSFVHNDGVVQNNVFSKNGTGISWVTQGWPCCDRPMILSGNRVANSTGDGINVTGGFVEIFDNVSMFNGGWGIYAPNEIDEGGNQAWGNGNFPQCYILVC